MNKKQGDGSFLGTGWGFPPSFTQGGAQVTMVSGNEDIVQSLRILLGTSLGERIMQDQFGCNLNDAVFEKIGRNMVNLITNTISKAVIHYEPRIDMNRIDVSADDAQAGLLHIRLDYTVKNSHARYSLVYPFYLSEPVDPGLAT